MSGDWKKIDFKNEIVNYINSLSETEKKVFKRVFDKQVAAGRDLRWIYFALEVIGTRSIISTQNLFNIDSFCEQVNDLIEDYKERRDREAARAPGREYAAQQYRNICIPALFGKKVVLSLKTAISMIQDYYEEGEEIPERVLRNAYDYATDLEEAR